MFGNASFAQARVAGHRMLDKHIAIIELEPIGAPTAPLEAGQQVVVQGRIDGRWVTRAYSLVNSAGTPTI
jgi:nitric-oxide synthase